MKPDLRKQLRARLQTISPEMREEAALRALELLQQSGLIAPNTVLAGYMPMVQEFDVLPILNWHSTCALPVITVQNAPLQFRRYKVGDSLQQNQYNISEPLASAPLVTPDVILVPLLGFDRRGGRLGQGGGFYDRTLAALPQALCIGVGFAAQECPEIPMEAHDIRLRAILTEKEVLQLRR